MKQETKAQVLALILAIPAMMFSGYILSIMWGWFVVPAFGLPQIQVATAIGLTGIFRFMAPSSNCMKEEEDNSVKGVLANAIAKGFLTPTVFLLLGWMVKSTM